MGEAESVNEPRAYRSPTRDRQRAATAAAIAAAAAQCFTDQGYARTTIAAVAEKAEVSVQSVYAIFGTKRDLLRASIEQSVDGGGSGEGMLREEWLRSVRAEPDQRRRLELMADATRDAVRRVAPLDEVVREAAATDPEIAAMQRENEKRRLEDVRVLVGLLEEVGPLRLSTKDATDVMWALSRSTDLYRSLTVDRRWSHRHALDALGDVLARTLFIDPPSA